MTHKCKRCVTNRGADLVVSVAHTDEIATDLI